MIWCLILAGVCALALLLTGHIFVALIVAALFVVLPALVVSGFQLGVDLAQWSLDHWGTVVVLALLFIGFKLFGSLRRAWEMSEEGQSHYTQELALRVSYGELTQKQARKEVKKKPHRYPPVIRERMLR